jgi:transcriptional/translational regulatory protein YebC/TACO1
VAYQFERKGVFSVNSSEIDEDTLMGIALDAGAEDIKRSGSTLDVTCDPAHFNAVQEALKAKGLNLTVAEISQVGKAPVDVDAETAKKVMRLMEALDDHDDVQNVYSTLNLTEEVMAEMAKE